MAFTTTINYVQNIPQSLGLSNYLNPVPSRTVSVLFAMDAINVGGPNMGTVNVPSVAGVAVENGRYGINGVFSGSVKLTGEVSAVNTALNSAEWVSHAYPVEDIDQDYLAADRDIDNSHGELQIQIPAGSDITGLAVGTQVRFSTAASIDANVERWTITKIDSTNSPIRLWLVYNRDYTLSDEYHSSCYDLVYITSSVTNPCWLQTAAFPGVNIAPVIDVSYGNAAGNLSIIMQVIDGATENNTFNLVGSPAIAEPSFTTLPSASASTGVSPSWYTFPNMGAIQQADNNYQAAQLLIKCLENDPMYLGVAAYTSLPGYPTSGTEAQKLQFVGDAIHAKASLSIPKYITDKSYGTFGDTQVDVRASISYQDGVVRWSYYDIPANINKALGRIYYWRPLNMNKDFTTEVRIVNNKARIYATKGK